MNTTVLPPSPTASGAILPKIEAIGQMKPAGFWIRLLASIIDGIIVGIFMMPFYIVLIVLPEVFMFSKKNFESPSDADALKMLGGMLGMFFIYFIIYFFVHWSYFSWFYKNKGASLGKMALKLKVVDYQTGQNIGWGKTFLRDILGKFVSAIILYIGFLMTGFREDKRALHDLIANTQVLQKIG